MSDKSSVIRNAQRRSTPLETSELIELIRQHPCLWDRNEPDYRVRQRKDHAWKEICRAIVPTYDEMSRTERHEIGIVMNRKWCNIRDCYKKHLKSSTKHNPLSRSYLHAEQLSFLDVIYAPKDQTEIQAKKRERYTEDLEDTETQQDEWLNGVFIEMENTEDNPLPEPSKKVKIEYPRTKESNDYNENILSVLVNLIEKEEDEDRAFFRSIIPTVKSLSDDDKFVFRIQVMKLLSALKKKCAVENVSQESDTE